MTNAKFARDEWTMKGELSLRGPSYSPTPFESRWVRAEWADAEIERLRAKVASLDNVIDYWKARAGGSSEPSERHAKGCGCLTCADGITRSDIEQGASRDASTDDPNKVKCVICGMDWGMHSAEEQDACSAAL